MIVYEKMRALCQQLPGYQYASVGKTRARDLYDIYIAIQKSDSLDLKEAILSPDNVYILEEMFKAKDVPLDLILDLKTYKENLKQDYNVNVIPQISDRRGIPEFDFLFDFNIELIEDVYDLLSRD